MNQDQIDRLVRRAQNCTHDRFHYLDHNGNRICLQCETFVRPIDGVAMLTREERTLTEGYVNPMWHFMRNQENRARVEFGLPPLTYEPKIQQQERWVTDWQDRT